MKCLSNLILPRWPITLPVPLSLLTFTPFLNTTLPHVLYLFQTPTCCLFLVFALHLPPKVLVLQPPIVWNSLSSGVCDSSSTHTFHRSLKTPCFQQAFSSPLWLTQVSRFQPLADTVHSKDWFTYLHVSVRYVLFFNALVLLIRQQEGQLAYRKSYCDNFWVWILGKP